MSSIVKQPSPRPAVVNPEQAIEQRRSVQIDSNKRARYPQSSSSSSTRRRPSPLELPKTAPLSLAILEMEEEDLSSLKSVIADQVSFEITQLYSAVETLSKEDSSLEVKQGLKALEEHIRLREYIHVKRTTASGD